MKKVTLGLAASGAILAGLLAAWWLAPRKLGLAAPRWVLVEGNVTVDGARGRAAQELPIGARLRTAGMASGCFSLHASRVCLGTGSDVRLVSLGPRSAGLQVEQGTVLVRTAADDVRLDVPGGSVEVSAQGLAAVETTGGEATARVFEGAARVTGGSRPQAVVPSGAAIGVGDGKPRPAAPSLEAEGRQVMDVARGWQGTAGAIVEVKTAQGHIELDGHDVGHAPASFLLAEGPHTIVVRDGPHDGVTQSVDLGGGQKVVIGD